MNPLVIVTTLARVGMLTPTLPHRQIAQLWSLKKWGFGLAGELHQAAARSPQSVAIVDEQRGEITYAELLVRTHRVAEVLRVRGVIPGQRVGLMARNHVGAVEVMAAASIVGADLVLINTGLAGDQLAAVITAQSVQLVIHDDEFEPALTKLADSIERITETELEAELARVPHVEKPSPPERMGRTIILTSGTTGTPKGAARKTPGGLGPLVSIVDRIPLKVGDRILISAPIFHTWGYAALQLSFGLRAAVVMRRSFDPADAVQTLEREGCTGMFAVPVMLQRIIERLPHDPDGKRKRPNLRVVATSGSAYPHGFTTRLMDEFGDVLYNLYGSTEASWVCIATPEDMRRHCDTAGTPPVGTVVKILDADGKEVSDGDTGRIFCGNELVFDGYTSGDDKDRVDGMVSTGDMGHVKDGLYFVDGRDDDMIVSGGENVYPAEVETLLIEHPAVREVAVIGVPDEEYGQRLAAFIACEEGQSLTKDEVRDLVRAHRARHVVPREVIFLDELPRNATGKVLARELRPHVS